MFIGENCDNTIHQLNQTILELNDTLLQLNLSFITFKFAYENAPRLCVVTSIVFFFVVPSPDGADSIFVTVVCGFVLDL